MPEQDEPVSSQEVTEVVLRAIANSFGKRPLDIYTAKRGLAMAAYDLSMIHIRAAIDAEGNGKAT